MSNETSALWAKKYRKIIIGAIILTFLLTAFILVNNSIKQKRLTEERKKEDIEVQNKLDELEVAPLIQKEEIKTQKGTKKTEAELIQEEDVMILSFVNSSQCDELVYLKEKCRDKFLYILSVRGGNLSYCDRLKSEQEKSDCRDEINNNSGNCSSIKNTFLKNKCEYNNRSLAESKNNQEILKTAVTQLNSNLCKSLTSYSQKETCVRNIAVKTKNTSLCKSIFTVKTDQDKCIKNTSYELSRAIIAEAYTKRDLTICDKLTDITLKTQCKSMKF